MAHTYDITIKSGADTITFSPSDYQIQYTSLAAPNSGRTMDATMKIEWKARVIPKLVITLPNHYIANTLGATVISLVQGQEYKVTYYDYLKHEWVYEMPVYTSETSMNYSFNKTVQEISFEAIAMHAAVGAGNVPHYMPNTVTITAAAYPSVGGQVIGGGTYIQGSRVELIAVAESGYTFTGWDGGQTTPILTFTATANASFTANFSAGTPTYYTVTTQPNEAGRGTTSGGGTNLTYGSTVNISATPNEGYVFTQWNDGNTSPSRTVTVTGNAVYTAYFNVASEEYWLITWDDDPYFVQDDSEQGETWDVTGTSCSVQFESNSRQFGGIYVDSNGELIMYGSDMVWEGSGDSTHWEYSNPNYQVIKMTTDPALSFTGDWAYFLAENGTVQHYTP